MIRPKLYEYKKPKHINDYPAGTSFKAGHLITNNASYRTHKPVINQDLCTGCFVCYISCPEGCIIRLDRKPGIDYAFCKGCGICAYECRKKAIHMEKE